MDLNATEVLEVPRDVWFATHGLLNIPCQNVRPLRVDDLDLLLRFRVPRSAMKGVPADVLMPVVCGRRVRR